MKSLLLSIVAVVAAIAAAFFIHKDPGQVDVVFQGLHYGPLSLGIVVAGLVVAFVAFYIFMRILLGLINTPKNLRQRSVIQKERKSYKALDSGLMQLAEGSWENAENTLTRNTSGDPASDAVKYIAAARAATEREQYEIGEQYLEKASNCSPQSEVPVGISRAEIMIRRNDSAAAIKLLSEIRNKAPNNGRILWLLAQSYQNTSNWQELSELLPLLRRKNAATPEKIEQLENTTWINIISLASDSQLDDAWSSLPKQAHDNNSVVVTYARRQNEMGESETAIKLVKSALGNEWSDELVELYGDIKSSDLTAQLDQAEKWYQDKSDNVSLLYTLGKLSYHRQLWAKAKDYANKALDLSPSSGAYHLLGEVLEAMEDKEAAMASYKAGAALSSNVQPVLQHPA